MSKFGIIGEGITDQITIENILCGFFENPDLDEDIEYLKPPRKNNKQDGHNNWLLTLNHLKTEDFRNEVLGCKFVIIQIDTDVSEEKHFDISKLDEHNKELSPEDLIKKVIEKCISIMNSGDDSFYDNHKRKIFFAISVHQLECWLYAHYNNQPRIKSCFKALDRFPFDKKIPRCPNKKEGCCLDKTGMAKTHDKVAIQKTYDCYNKLSNPFLKRKNIDRVAKKDPSFNLFIQQLQNIVVD